MSKIKWRSEPIGVKKSRDEMWLEEKFQSNSEIAGSPRNSFRTSLEREIYGGRALKELGVRADYQTLSNSEYHIEKLRSQTAGAKFRGQKGKSPDRQIRSPRCS